MATLEGVTNLVYSSCTMIALKLLPRNARASIKLEPLWALFGPLVTYFMPLYQKELGLSEVQMGAINSVAIATGFVFYALASPITNKLGRRYTSIIFDSIAWSIAMLVWAFSRSFGWFLLAQVLNSVVRIVVVSWNLLITEDATERERAAIYGWIYVIGAFGGLSTFLGGIIIQKFGLVPSMRIIFILGSMSMSIMFILRFIWTTETAPGLYLKDKLKNESFFKLVVQQIPSARDALKDKNFLLMTGIYILASAVLSIDFFRILFLTETKSIPSWAISIIPATGALSCMAVFFLLLPSRKNVPHVQSLKNGFLLSFLFQGAFLLIPHRSAIFAIIIVSGLQTCYFLIQTFRDTVFMNMVRSDQKSELFSLVQALMLFFTIPMGWLAGWLFEISQDLPFILAGILYALGFLLSIKLQGHNETRKTGTHQ